MLLLLAKEGYRPDKQVKLYDANMKSSISDFVAGEQPKTLAKARKYATRAELVDTHINASVQVNTISQWEIAKLKLIKIGFDPSTVYIGEKWRNSSRSRSRGRSTERKPNGSSRRKQAHSPRRGLLSRSSSQKTNRSSSNKSYRSSSRRSAKSSHSSERSSSKESHKSSLGRSKGRSSMPYRHSKI